MLRLAVVGTGIIGVRHLEVINQSQECTLCAICDVNEENVKELAAKYNVPYFIDYKEILKEIQVDAVILNLPHFLHCEATEYFLDQGVHVLVEKPMANTVEECDRMIAAAKRNQKVLAVGHSRRFAPAIRRIKEIYESGELGKLCMFQETRTQNYFKADRPRWFLDKKMSGGGITMNYGAHALDSLFYVTGHQEARVTAASVDNIKNNEEIEGHAQILLELPDGVSANITFSAYTYTGYETIWFFTEGAAKVVDGSRLWLNKGGAWVEQEYVESLSMQYQLAEFCKLIKGEETEMITPECARAIVSTIEEVYRKSIEGKETT